jgi:DNA-binding response OmpR family regulator
MYTIGKPLSVLVFARPDRLSDALISLLSGMQMIKEIDRIEDLQQAILTIASKKIDLVLLDMLSDEAGLRSLISRIKQGHQGTYCLSVVDTVHLARVSQQSGADHVLLRGFSGNELLDVIIKAQTHHSILDSSSFELAPV